MNLRAKLFVPVMSGLLSAILLTGCANNNSTANATTASSTTINAESSELQRVGYSLGYMMAMSNKDMIDDLDLDAFEAGFRDAYADNDSALTDEQMEEVLVAYEARKREELMQNAQVEASTNLVAGQEFLQNNANDPDVQTTQSGLQYKVIESGTGASPSEGDVVMVHYEGKLLDGTVFDSSYAREEPAVFAVQGMIPGFAEGLKLMQAGGTYELFIPADLAYGEIGAPGIAGNSTLIFRVELLEVNPDMPAPQ